MKRSTTALLLAALAFSPVASSVAFAEGVREERREHPRISKAIEQLEDAIAYLEAAPHDFGGHKAAAVEASRHAVEQLRLALAFRAGEDTRRRR
jgi:hypothetical protein